MKLGACQDGARVKGDRHRHFHVEAVNLGGDDVKVEETDDYWIIPDTGLTREGVMNGGLKPREELARTWVLANGIPFTHDHPRDEDEFGVIVDLRRVGGFVDNIRFNDESGDVVGDVFLAKQTQEGLDVDDANVTRNRILVTAIQAGEEAEVSIGFWSTDEWNPGTLDGVDYEWVQREILYDHLASVPLGACSWGMGCGLGRHQGSEPNALNGVAGLAGTQVRMSKEEEAAAKQEQEQREAAAKGDCGEDPAPPAAGEDPPAASGNGLTAEAARSIEDRLKALEAERRAERDAAVKERRVKLASLLDSKPEDLPDGLTVPVLDAWIKREQDLQGITDPPLVTGDGQGRPSTTYVMGEEVDGVTMTPRGMTVTDWAAAEAHAAKNAKTGNWNARAKEVRA